MQTISDELELPLQTGAAPPPWRRSASLAWRPGRSPVLRRMLYELILALLRHYPQPLIRFTWMIRVKSQDDLAREGLSLWWEE